MRMILSPMTLPKSASRWVTTTKSCAARWPPVARRRRLWTRKFSLPFLVAVAIVHRDVALEHFVEWRIARSDGTGNGRKSGTGKDSAFDWKMELPGGRVELITRDGRNFSRIGTEVPGSSAAPLTWEDLARKFAKCAAVAIPPLKPETIATVQTMLRDLETVEDVNILMRILHAC